MKWQTKSFEQLSTTELFEIYKLRTAVFVVEQDCPYQEVDDKDLISYHHFAKKQQNLTAYCRIFLQEDGVHIGRVLVAIEARGSGLARELMQTAIAYAKQTWPQHTIYIQAQSHLAQFYQSLGFSAISDVYLEDNIPHPDMALTH
ncbi:GNAT family N-acetyltransferase [Actinobacillus equuli]|uniref:GNAT family N-acetyltransferase n=1 Tax=Actinobacillus equuli TaxID=718 RepID=UPI0024422516|nr:GNAT family N-acetyltransferase [Actinobacillus equuli]WGE60339.1 GNAT family N-acetyltransferase [Actinobacillus equuli subsp. haemolyticus]